MDKNNLNLSDKILAKTPSIVYISDIETYELYFINDSLSTLYNNAKESDWKGKKCYEFLQGRDKPCDFCTNHLLKDNETHSWAYYNLLIKKYYSLRDSLITLENGKKARLEIGYDITDTYDLLMQEKAVNECIETLHSLEDPHSSINKLLEILTKYYDADRGYIFQYDKPEDTFSNTYEWCPEHIKAEKEILQNIPYAYVTNWIQRFQDTGEFYIESLDDEIITNSPACELLKAQNIHSLIAAPLLDKKENITGFIGVDNPKEYTKATGLIRSITHFIADFLDKAELFQQLKLLSYTDSLTHVKNRHSYEYVLEQYGKNPPLTLGIIYTDMNGLKNINDKHGHKYGDNLLISLANILKENFQTSVYRLGGDEFIVICENMPKTQFDIEVTKIKENIDAHPNLDVSLGTTWTDNCQDIMKQIDHADGLMYMDKQYYYQNSQANPKYKTTLLNTLKSEIERGLFTVYLQPQVDLQSLKVISAEALIRKINNKGELIPPDSFIPLYENLGIIDHIDFFVFKTICETLKEWQDKHYNDNLTIAVNFSRHTLLQNGIIPYLSVLCTDYNITPSRITIEITESMQGIDKYQLLSIIKEFTDNGFHISLDDFGSGYSNLSLLSEANFNEVKIDKTLVDTITASNKTNVLVKNVINVCSDLQINSSVAEGIETESQYSMLKTLNCQKGQGYLFSKPIPIKEFTEKYIIPQALTSSI